MYSKIEGFSVVTKFVHLLNQIPQAFPRFLGTIELSNVL